MRKGHPLESKCSAYLESLRSESRLQPSSLRLYESELKTLLSHLESPEDLSGLKKHLLSCAPATHLRKLVIWRSFLKNCSPPWRDALENLRSPKLRSKQPTFLTDEEQFKLESACYRSKQMTRDRLLVALALQLGLRLAEILQLRFSDIEDQWIRLIRKGGKEQRLPLSPALKTLIKFWRDEARPASAQSFVFEGRTSDQPITSRTAQFLIQKLCKKAGIQKRISPHSLRHTFASTLASRGASLVALKDILGHQRLSTTERYLHVTPTHLQETFALLTKTPNPPA